MREFAIINVNDENFSENILKFLPSDSKITVFRTKDYDFNGSKNVEVVKIPEEIRNCSSKIKNFVSKHYFDANFKGFLHILEDQVEILKDPNEFLDKIEEMMTKLKLKSWFNTETDPCNYTFTFFNPRISVTIDEEPAKSEYDKTIYWTSHANMSWVCYNLNLAEFDDVKLNDSFDIAMFYIIEFLSRRRNTKKPGELYYMNFYPTIKEERKVFKLKETNPYDKKNEKTNEEKEKENKKMGEENAIFESLKVNHSPDTVIEPIIEDLFNILTKK